MPKAIDLSTIGARFGYGYESTAGTRPTAYTNVPNPKSTPDFNPEPNTGETTSLNNEEFTSYMPLLKDLGGALAFTIGMSQKLLTDWNAMCDTAETNETSGRATWFTVYHPGLSEAMFFPGKPTRLTMPAMETNQVWDATVYVTPTGEPVMATAVKPVDASESA